MHCLVVRAAALVLALSPLVLSQSKPAKESSEEAKPDEIAAAVAFERQKDAAAARQAALKEKDLEPAAREKAVPAEGLAAAIAFERHKDQAAARQERLNATAAARPARAASPQKAKPSGSADRQQKKP